MDEVAAASTRTTSGSRNTVATWQGVVQEVRRRLLAGNVFANTFRHSVHGLMGKWRRWAR